MAADIEALRLRGVEPPSHPAPAAAPGPGAAYAAHLASLASRDVPAFICHFYNVYFAHTAGGAMIGRSLTAALDLPPQRFWSYDGVDLAGSMDGVRGKINAAAEEWSEEQRQHCLAETGRSFEMSGKLLRLLVAPEPAAAAV